MYRYLLLGAVLLHCGYEFPTGYETIESNKVRPIAVIYDNNGLAEGAPMDTLAVHAYFGGEKIESIVWSFLSDSNGADTNSVQNIIMPGTYKEYIGTNSDSVILSIIIPDSLIRREFADVKNVGAIIPGYMHNSLPPGLLQRKPGEVLDVLEFLSYNPDIGPFIVDSLIGVLTGDEKADTKTILPVILQIFSVSLKAYAVINKRYKMESYLTIRYNKKLSYLGSFIPVNVNPQIEYIRLYLVQGERESFDPGADLSSIDTFYDLATVDTIPFKTGDSYFLVVARKSGPVDIGVSLSGLRDAEHHTCEWFLQDNNKSRESDPNSLRIAQNMSRNSVVKIIMSSNPVQSFTVWCVIYDYFLGERLRPVGFAMSCARGVIVARN